MSSLVPRGSIHSFGTSDFISIRDTVLAGISVVTGTQHQRGKKTAWHVLRVHRYILRRGAKGVSTPPVHYASRRWSVSHLQARNGRRSPHGVGPGLEPHGRVQTLRWLHARPVREMGSTPPRRGKLVPTCHGRGPALHLRWRLAAYPVYSVGSARAHTVYGCMACSWLATVGRLAICK